MDLNIEIRITENFYNESNAVFNYEKLKKETSIVHKKTNWKIFKNINSENAFTGGQNKSMKIIKKQLTA